MCIRDRYKDISLFSDGLSAVKKEEKWGYIDTSGKLVIQNIYDKAEDFHDGVAAVKKGDQTWFIDKRGRKVSPPR